jgi:hypothetical protein
MYLSHSTIAPLILDRANGVIFVGKALNIHRQSTMVRLRIVSGGHPMHSAYLASAFNRSDASGWFVLRSREGRLVAQGLTQAHAMTLASVLNFTAEAVSVQWWEARSRFRNRPS